MIDRLGRLGRPASSIMRTVSLATRGLREQLLESRRARCRWQWPNLRRLTGSDPMAQQYDACIEACNDCAVSCNECVNACLQEDDVKMMARCVALDIDCAAICQMAAAALARDSQFSSEICATCAAICDACGDECAKHKMAHCQKCAEACRRCAEECRRMTA